MLFGFCRYLAILDLRDVVFIRSLFETTTVAVPSVASTGDASAAANSTAQYGAFEAPPSWLSAAGGWRAWDDISQATPGGGGQTQQQQPQEDEEAESKTDGATSWTSAVALVYDLYTRSFGRKHGHAADASSSASASTTAAASSTGGGRGRSGGGGGSAGSGSSDIHNRQSHHPIEVLSVLEKYSSAGGLGRLVMNLNPLMPMTAAASYVAACNDDDECVGREGSRMHACLHAHVSFCGLWSLWRAAGIPLISRC